MCVVLGDVVVKAQFHAEDSIISTDSKWNLLISSCGVRSPFNLSIQAGSAQQAVQRSQFFHHEQEI